MLNKISHAIIAWYSLRVMLVLFAGVAFFFWMFNFSSFPLSSPELRKLSNGADLLDVRFYYFPEEAFCAIDRYGASGRALYLRFLAADFIFAPVYGVAFSLLLTRMSRTTNSPASRWNNINVLPVLIAFADVAENVCILLLLLTYPARYVSFASLAGIATVAKWSLTIITLCVLAILCLHLMVRRFQSSGKVA
jgi:hypothetical protein